MKNNTLFQSGIYLMVFIFSILTYLMSPPQAGAAETAEKSGQMVSIDYKDASLATVLRALSLTYDLNLVITKDIRGTVTTTLNDVTIDEALEAILGVNGYMFTRRGNLIYVTPGPGIEGIDLVTESIRLKYLTASEAERLLGNVISSKGDIQVNESTNSLLLTDFPVNIGKVKGILKDIDIPPTQVLIEAKILDIQSKVFENLGQTTTFTEDPRGSGEDGGVFFRDGILFDESVTTTSTLPGPSSTLSGGQWTLTANLRNHTVSMTIDALIQDNKAHLLATPSITTLNGKEARIIIGEKFPYTEKTQTTTGTTETTKFVDVGTTLRVTPIVSPDGWITMNVHPEVSSVSAALDAGPRITTREADAVVRVKDGDTIIIGGLINNQDDRIESGIPYLRKIPILGKVFQKRSKDLQETELTVFITPKIIRSPEDLAHRSDIVEEEVILSVEAVGQPNLVAKLFEHAERIENNESPETAYKTWTQRNQELLNTYKMIANNYPNDPMADKALYKVGSIYFDCFADYDAAKRIFASFIEKYPDSHYRKKAEIFLKKASDKNSEKESMLFKESLRKEM